ncbi:MAG: type II toxin-antitoxin system VapC family toxin [Gammaproteobacteria bacterium]|nr:type II toxin-antitoxin system VapC family toxin [Gammaproteobacteria bacterium]
MPTAIAWNASDALIVDASVWVSAADASDALSAPSRSFLTTVARQRTPIVLPAIARLEVACALTRRLHDARRGRKLAERLLQSPLITEIPLDAPLLAAALTQGTKSFLRAGDAFYAAVARNGGGTLIAWDDELVRRAGAMTPEAWLVKYGGD